MAAFFNLKRIYISLALLARITGAEKQGEMPLLLLLCCILIFYLSFSLPLFQEFEAIFPEVRCPGLFIFEA